eukprot:363695-Chlamydomonas_euryale.AAC.5
MEGARCHTVPCHCHTSSAVLLTPRLVSQLCGAGMHACAASGRGRSRRSSLFSHLCVSTTDDVTSPSVLA